MFTSRRGQRDTGPGCVNENGELEARVGSGFWLGSPPGNWRLGPVWQLPRGKAAVADSSSPGLGGASPSCHPPAWCVSLLRPRSEPQSPSLLTPTSRPSAHLVTSVFAACPLTPSMVTSLLLPPLVPPPWSFTLQGVPLNEPSVAPTCVSNSQSPSCGPQCLRLPSPAVISPFPPHLCLPAFPLHTLLLPHRVCCLLYIGQGHINTAFVACY